MSGPESIPESCQAAVFLGANRPLELRSFPIPALLPGEALAKVECCTVCGSDLHTFAGKRSEPTPSILGHEILGRIAALGAPGPVALDGQALEVGERVTWSTAISCGVCDRCVGGLPQKCRTLAKYGHERAEGRAALCGGLGEYVLLRAGSQIARVDEALPAEVLCPANCATATIAAAIRIAGALEGKRVLIFGAGMLGLTAAAMSQTLGAAEVALCDVDPGRLGLASSFGAQRAFTWNDLPDEQFDVILELAGSPDAVEAACRRASIGGRIVLVGSVMKSRPASIDPELVVRNWLTISGVHNYAPSDLQTAVDFLRRFHSRFPFAKLVAREYSLAQVNDAFVDAIRERPVRVAIRPGKVQT